MRYIASNDRPDVLAEVVSHRQPAEPRFYELDILRGVAALMVVVFHYKHFLLISDSLGFDVAHLPFSGVLGPLYVYGQFFVELFFSISGYVFFWLYATAIADRHTSGGTFFVARFARLYPLYFATLVFVAVGQILFLLLYGHTFIYHSNTPGYFILNLFMVHEWLPHAAMSFNGPSWSISVEVFLYLLFFGLCLMRLNNPLVLIGVIALGIAFKVVFAAEASDFGRGVPSFFLGGLVYHIVTWLRDGRRDAWRKGVTLTLAWLLPPLWLLTYAGGAGWLAALPAPLNLAFSTDGFVFVVLPASLLFLGLRRDTWRARFLQAESLHKVAWVGDISYSLYLLHFPLQLSVMLIMAHLSDPVRAAVFGSPLFFIAFFAAAIGLSWLSFTRFEMPMRRWLKLHMTRRLAQPSVIQ